MNIKLIKKLIVRSFVSYIMFTNYMKICSTCGASKYNSTVYSIIIWLLFFYIRRPFYLVIAHFLPVVSHLRTSGPMERAHTSAMYPPIRIPAAETKGPQSSKTHSRAWKPGSALTLYRLRMSDSGTFYCNAE